VLHSVLTIISLREAKLLMPWEPGGEHLAKRNFYFSAKWRDAWQRLPGRPISKRVQWNDEDAGLSGPNDEPSWPDGSELIDPAIDPSIRGRLSGLIETFVRGWPRSKLIRKDGFGMEPPFKRMRPPLSSVVEMRTEYTRTFGFFAGPRVFVGHRLDLADVIHANPQLYLDYGADVMRMLARIAESDKDQTSDIEDLIGEC
jgi:hypothetical protein